MIALIGAGIHLGRHPAERGRATGSRVVLMYWLGIVTGFGMVFAAMFHIFDAESTAEGIGFVPWFPQSTGAFQFENAMGDLAIGVAGLLCFWIRDPKFWLAVIVIATIQLWGDAYGHIHQTVAYDNDAPDNGGAILLYDILSPVVLIVLYLMSGRGRALPETAPT